MGACASKFKVSKDAADAPPPSPKEEVASREFIKEIVKKDGALVVAADNDAKHQSLGHLFKENEGEKGSAENNGKAFEEVKQEDRKPQENGNAKSPEPVADAPVKDEREKPAAVDDVKSNTSEEKKAEDVKLASENVEVEGNADTNPCMDKKPQKPAAEKKKTEENLAENTKPETSETMETEEQKPASDAEDKKMEEKPVEASKIETSEKVEDKHVVELLETEKPEEKKPEENSVTNEKPGTPDTETKEQNPASDAEDPKAGEEKTKE